LFAHKHFAELCFQLEVHSPYVICVQETWLDDSIKEVTIPGYVICSRRDRHKGANRGGIAVFRREDFNGIVHITNSSIYMYPITAASHVTMGGVPNMNPK
jgi:hypothetical protein